MPLFIPYGVILSAYILHSNYTQYGPYTTLGKGDYMVQLLGEGFAALTLTTEALYINTGGNTGDFSISNITINDDMITYNISLNDRTANIELGLHNNSEREVKIYELQIYENIKLPGVLQDWW